MIIAIPVMENKGMESVVYGHFGSAPMFAFYNTETNSAEFIENKNDNHGEGQCTPTVLISDKAANFVITQGMGRRAVSSLNSIGVKVLLAEDAATLKDVAEKFKANAFREMCADDACSGHH